MRTSRTRNPYALPAAAYERAYQAQPAPTSAPEQQTWFGVPPVHPDPVPSPELKAWRRLQSAQKRRDVLERQRRRAQP